jgi:hypothetical protein
VLLLGTAAGCGQRLPVEESALRSTSCAPRGDPLRATVVARALRRHGFDVTISREPCHGTTINAEVESRRASRYGVHCAVHAPPTSWGHAIRRHDPSPQPSIFWHGVKGSLLIENVQCQLYPHPTRKQEEMTRLVAAADDLRRLVGIGP